MPKHTATSSTPAPVATMSAKACTVSATLIASRPLFSAALVAMACRLVVSLQAIGSSLPTFPNSASFFSARRRRPPATTSNLSVGLLLLAHMRDDDEVLQQPLRVDQHGQLVDVLAAGLAHVHG